jgi:hypothetical protein
MIAAGPLVMFARSASVAFIGPSLQMRTLTAESIVFFSFSFSPEGVFEWDRKVTLQAVFSSGWSG